MFKQVHQENAKIFMKVNIILDNIGHIANFLCHLKEVLKRVLSLQKTIGTLFPYITIPIKSLR